MFGTRSALEKEQTMILQDFRRPQGPTKTANSDFKICFAARRAVQKLQTVLLSTKTHNN